MLALPLCFCHPHKIYKLHLQNPCHFSTTNDLSTSFITCQPAKTVSYAARISIFFTVAVFESRTKKALWIIFSYITEPTNSYPPTTINLNLLSESSQILTMSKFEKSIRNQQASFSFCKISFCFCPLNKLIFFCEPGTLLLPSPPWPWLFRVWQNFVLLLNVSSKSVKSMLKIFFRSKF